MGKIFKVILTIVFCFYLILPSACKENNSIIPPVDTTAVDSFVKGADVSWVTEMEAAGKKFYNKAGSEMEAMALLKSLGMNTVRLRVWVNPANSWNSTSDVLTKALRAKKLGLRIMIDFHYSDSWADPGQQTKPAAWNGLTFAELKTTLQNYTTNTLTYLKTNGITPEWVQVGNETSDGMLWPEGKASTNMSNFSALVTAGYDAVKSVFPDAKVIVHISNGYNNSTSRWIFDGLKNYNAKWDVIGLSVYPSWFPVANDWANCNLQVYANMKDMVSRYGKQVMIVECGMSWDNANAKSFLSDLISKVKLVPGNNGLGVMYWEPQCYGGWNSYTLGAFDNTGKPTIALDAFK